MTGLIALSMLLTPTPTHTWEDIVQPNFHDCTFTARAIKANESELKKISRDFAVSYRFFGSDVRAKIKEPFMVRLESNVEGTEVLYIENGGRRIMKIPKLRIGKREDVTNAPGKRQTMMDFGMLTPSLFQNLFEATFVRQDRETGNVVYDLTFKHPLYDDTSRQRVWVDPEKRYITKRVWFAQDGHEKATFLYEDPKSSNGIWFPSKAVVKNVDLQIAGVTEYFKMKINAGLGIEPFQF